MTFMVKLCRKHRLAILYKQANMILLQYAYFMYEVYNTLYMLNTLYAYQ